jgi:hypothetical protein
MLRVAAKVANDSRQVVMLLDVLAASVGVAQVSRRASAPNTLWLKRP